jgi:YfiH family protein
VSVEVNRARALDGVAHGFLGRRGGVSTGITAGLDLGRRGQVEISPELAENRRRAIDAVLPGAELVTLYQVHSADCATLSMPWDDTARPHADAVVTDRPRVALGILTADCAPVLLADRTAGIVGAAHAGWKGAIGGVTDATVAAMEKLGADRDRIVAAIGPCIARANYEVDEAFQRRFEADDPANERFFAPGRDGHAQFDLEGYVAHRLAAAGVRTIEMMGLDTYADADRFYSFRRATHRGEPDYGRQISIIGLQPAG